MLYRFASSVPVALAATVLFLRTRRLTPLIVAHVLLDVMAPLSTLFRPEGGAP